MRLVGQLSAVPTPVLVALALVVLIEIGLDVIALVDLYRRPVAQVAIGNKWIWVAIIVLVNLLGAILYLAIGRRPAPAVDSPRPGAPGRQGVNNVIESLYGPGDSTDR